MIDIKYSMFFDKAGVIAKVKDGTKSALSKFGAFVRRTAKTSIKRAPKKKTYVAQEGSPPRSHTGRLKDLIYFGYDAATESVVVGPQLFRRKSPTVPNLLEFGGTTTHWRTGKPATYRQFPYMQPALEQEAPKFAGLFEGAIKG